MLSWLNSNTIQGVLRALMTFGAGILVSKGLATQDQSTSVVSVLCSDQTIGAFTTVATIIWSVLHKQQSAVAAPMVVSQVAPIVATPAPAK